jgi:molybdate transport system permease protein
MAGIGDRLAVAEAAEQRSVWQSVRGRPLRAIPLGLAVLLVLYQVVPLVAVLWYGIHAETLHALGDQFVLAALRLTGLTTFCAVLAAIVAGTPLAYYLARNEFRGKAIVETVIELPIALPPLVAGVGLLLAFGRRGLFGPVLENVGITLPFTTAAVVLAQIFIAVPFYVRGAVLGLRAVPRELEEAAAMDGASEWVTFVRVVLPLALPGMLSGLLLCATRAAAEFGATLMFAGNFPGRTQTMTLAIITAMETSVSRALALSVLLLLASVVVVLLARLLLGRQQTAGLVG